MKLLQLVQNYPRFTWDRHKLAANPAISIKEILNTPKERWNFGDVSMNPNLTAADVLNNPDHTWDGYMLVWHMSLQDIKAIPFVNEIYQDLKVSSPQRIVKNKKISLADLIAEDIPFTLPDISDKRDLTLEYVQQHSGIYKHEPGVEPDENSDWWWSILSANPAFTFEDITNNPDMWWTWSSVVRNPNVSFKQALTYPATAEFAGSSLNASISDILAHPELKWDNISRNPNINLKFVREHTAFKWFGFELSANPAITFQEINDSPREIYPSPDWNGWSWEDVSCNPGPRTDRQYTMIC